MKAFRPISTAIVLALALFLGNAAAAQLGIVAFDSAASSGLSADDSAELSAFAVAPASLSADLALATYQRSAEKQSTELAGYTATTVIEAELPDSSQKAEFELKRHYAAPAVLQFTPVRFTGDRFVKTNIIVRLLQSEAEHVGKREQAQTAISSTNYKFSYKGSERLDDAAVHVYEVKPRRKQVGLFKGRIYVDASTGRLRRAEGTVVKSPSFFIKKIDFVQDYETIEGFTFPVRMHSVALTRLVGKTVVNISHKDYQPELASVSDGEVEAIVATGGGTN